MRSSNAFYDVSMNRLLNKQSSCRWFEIPWHACDVTVMWVLGFGYCVTVAYNRMFMGVDVENNLIVQWDSAAAIFMRAGYWPWVHTNPEFGRAFCQHETYSFIICLFKCHVDNQPEKLVAIIWLSHTYLCTYPSRTVDIAASHQNSCEKKTSFNTSCAAFLILKIDIHTFCLSKCEDNE